MKRSLLLILFIVGLLATSQAQKINGISVVAPKTDHQYPSMVQVKTIGANWVCIMPYAFVDQTSGTVKFNHKWQWWGEKTEGVTKAIYLAKKQGLKVMVKPMLWLKDGSFTGTLAFDQLPKWSKFEKTYDEYLWEFAKIADSLNADLFCLGTEMKTFTQFKREFFPKTIKTYRDTFKMQLTFAANWDNYKNIAFWQDLDYIGIDAYFPGAPQKLPTVEQAAQGFVRTKYELKDFSEKNQKPILFTEYGFKSCLSCTPKPWEHRVCEEKTFICQQNALQGFYEKLYNEPWCAGGFLWKWYDTEEEYPNDIDSDYSPQGKPAIEIIKQNFH